MSDNEDGTAQPELEKHIFLSTVDSYTGRNLAELFTGKVQAVVPEEEEEEENEVNDEAEKEKKSLTTIHGVQRHSNTVSDPSGTIVLTEAQASDRETLLACLELCEIIIYDITYGGQEIVEEATWAVETLHDRLELWPKKKVFILISTVMTWAKTKPIDPDDLDSPFTEEDYRRRRPHPHFQEHLNCEKTTFSLGKTNKKKLKTYVIASGAIFGKGEDIFHSCMKQAWHNEKELTVFGRGNNVIPTIHILDLAQVVQCVFETRPTTRYILAVDGISNTQREIMKAISYELSTGQVKRADKEDVFLTDLSLLHADLVTSDLKMEGVFIADNIEERRCESGMVEGIAEVVKEFRTERKLQPMRVCILGPPVSGKTFLAEKLCRLYKLHHLHLSEIIEAAIKNLKEIAHPPVKDSPPVTLPDEKEGGEESPTMGEEEEEEEDEDENVDLDLEIEEEEEEEDEEKMTAEEAEELLQEMEEQRAANRDGRLDDATVLQFVEERIRSKPCRNQGFVLDGFPKLVEQAEALFGADEEADEAAVEGEPAYNRATMPELVIALEAPDEFLCERAINLPEESVQSTPHWTEEAVLRRIAEFRTSNKEDVTVLNFFDELEVHPLRVDVTQDDSDGMVDTCRLVQKRLGTPRNYGLTKEEAEERRQLEEIEKIEEEQRKREEAERCAREEMESRRREQMVWMERLTEVKRQELEALEARSLPLRSYLMKHVIPTLTQGLLECAKVKPEDPVDYLAEYLFTHNPQTNLVEWEELQKSKLESKEAARKQLLDKWLTEDTVEHVEGEGAAAERGSASEVSEHTSASPDTTQVTADNSSK